MRRDLADIRLAEQVFAPHYAAPLAMRVVARANLRRAAGANSEVIAVLAAGERFEMLDCASGTAWGKAPGAGLAGYVERAVLAPFDESSGEGA